MAGIWIGETGAERDNVISGNYIGIDANGTAAIPNSSNGVTIMHGAHHNTIGPDNLISGNEQNGITMLESDHSTVTSNRIGTNASGTAALPNGRNGMDIADCENIVIEGNLISGNTYVGLKIFVGGNSQVRDNIIGLNADGTAAMPNGAEGLIIEDAATNVTVGPDNVISGNELFWDDVTTRFGDLDPGGEISFTLHFRIFAAACDLGPLAVNCTHVAAEDSIGHVVEAHWCDEVTIAPGPPEIEVIKTARGPVVCVGDEIRFGCTIGNSGDLPITRLLVRDIYDTTYLGSVNDPAFWGPDDGELSHEFDFSGWPMGSGMVMGRTLDFLARAETPSTIDELSATANDDPTTTRSDTAEVTILPAPGLCEGNLVTNGGFEEGLTDWIGVRGVPRTRMDETHSGTSSLLLGILPGEPDVDRTDVLAQWVTIIRSQPFDTVQVYLDFDPALLQCVDAAGNPITETVPISPTLVLQNEVDNSNGQVNYVARVAFGEPPLSGRVGVIRTGLRGDHR